MFLETRLAAGWHDLLCGTLEYGVDGMPHAVHVCELLKTFRPSQANMRSTRRTKTGRFPSPLCGCYPYQINLKTVVGNILNVFYS